MGTEKWDGVFLKVPILTCASHLKFTTGSRMSSRVISRTSLWDWYHSFPGSKEVLRGCSPTKTCTHVSQKACTRWSIATMFTTAPKHTHPNFPQDEETHMNRTLYPLSKENEPPTSCTKATSLSNVMWVKDGRHKRENTVWFHLYKLHRLSEVWQWLCLGKGMTERDNAGAFRSTRHALFLI